MQLAFFFLFSGVTKGWKIPVEIDWSQLANFLSSKAVDFVPLDVSGQIDL